MGEGRHCGHEPGLALQEGDSGQRNFVIENTFQHDGPFFAHAGHCVGHGGGGAGAFVDKVHASAAGTAHYDVADALLPDVDDMSGAQLSGVLQLVVLQVAGNDQGCAGRLTGLNAH